MNNKYHKEDILQMIQNQVQPVAFRFEDLRFPFGFFRVPGEEYLLRKLLKPSLTEEQASYKPDHEIKQIITDWAKGNNLLMSEDFQAGELTYIFRNNDYSHIEKFRMMFEQYTNEVRQRPDFYLCSMSDFRKINIELLSSKFMNPCSTEEVNIDGVKIIGSHGIKDGEQQFVIIKPIQKWKSSSSNNA